jgi:NADH dehydrogenase FAD-containing subunit
MGPGVLGGAYTPEEIRFPVRQMTESGGGVFLEDKVQGVDPGDRTILLESGKQVSYDVVSFNTGSQVPAQVVTEDADRIFTVKPIENLLQGRELIQSLARDREVRVGVAGGGPGALEVAGNAWAAGRQSNGKGCMVRIYAGREFMRKAPGSVTKIARRVFAQRGIEIIEGSYVDKIATGQVTLQDGRSFKDDVIFLALGVRPRPLFGPSHLPAGDDGGLLVNRFLQSPEFPEVFGGGDCIWFQDQPLDKVGVYAVRQNPVLYHNVLAQMEGGELMPFDPGGSYLLIFNLGQGQGIFHKNGLVFNGGLAFRLKDYIDRRFIKKFKPQG